MIKIASTIKATIYEKAAKLNAIVITVCDASNKLIQVT